MSKPPKPLRPVQQPPQAAAQTLAETILAALPTGPIRRRTPNAALLYACARFAVLHGRRRALYFGDTRIRDDDAREHAEQPILRAMRPVLRQIVELPAIDLPSHRARAAVFVAQDDQDLLNRTEQFGLIGDRLLVSLLLDLMDSPQEAA